MTHRFGSHVIQTLLTLSSRLMEKEHSEGPSKSVKEDTTLGVLPSLQDSFLDMCEVKLDGSGSLGEANGFRPFIDSLLLTLPFFVYHFGIIPVFFFFGI